MEQSDKTSNDSDTSNLTHTQLGAYKVSKRPTTLTTEEKLIRAAENIVENNPIFSSVTSSLLTKKKQQKMSDDDLFGQLIANKLSKISEGDEKESLKLDIQFSIKNLQFSRNTQTVLQTRPIYSQAVTASVLSSCGNSFQSLPHQPDRCHLIDDYAKDGQM